ncbi:shikimate kinase [Sphingomonas sp.]|uniref:shikimate kinase n=1 Tax=Sphingomonas sp. TaxID=28214 RepID=UPI002600C436|nr:shikimate kinase [Sphingomonas sp.]MBV9526804.1 shikimate kinase [Sphingomonas sp.]
MAGNDAGQPGRSISLVGFMGAGKSKIGRLLADRLELPFVDIDQAIETARGMSVAAIFAAQGEAGFRAAERQAIADLLDGEPSVIALGGGAFVDPDSRARLNARSITVWLDPPFEILLSRLARSTARPLAAGRSESELRALWQDRRTSYAEAQVRIVTSDGDPQGFVDEIVARLG